MPFLIVIAILVGGIYLANSPRELTSLVAVFSLAGVIVLYQRVKQMRLEIIQLKASQAKFRTDSQSSTATPDEERVVAAAASSTDDTITPVEVADRAFKPPSNETFSSERGKRSLATSWEDSPLVQLFMGYFSGGNLFVRIGILVLFFGVAFLLKYAADNALLSIEYRLMITATGGIGLLAVGWYQRHKRRGYSLLLQGAGVGVLYLTVYAAYQLYGLLPPLLTFAFLFFICLSSVVLAVLQDSRSLAIAGVSGGFLAPILASTGDGNYIALFSYYLILNVGIVLVARYKAWRLLNLAGFFFTYVIATAWGVLQYRAANFFSVEPFLIAFFLIYIVVALLYAMQGRIELRKPLDGTLLFGNPLVAFTLQTALVRDYEYGLAWSAFVLGGFYLLMAKLLWNRRGEALHQLVQVFLALGVIFATMAIPFALDARLSAAAWAVEGSGILWLAQRQRQKYARYFALLLQFGAALLFLLRGAFTPLGDHFFNAFYLGCSMIAIAWLYSAWLLRPGEENTHKSEVVIGYLLLAGGVLWWLTGANVQFQHYFGHVAGTHNFVPYLSASMLLLWWVANQVNWSQGRLASLVVLPGLLLSFHVLNTFGATPLQQTIGWFAWPFSVITLYWLLKKENAELNSLDGLQALMHVGSALLLLLLTETEWMRLIGHWFEDHSSWHVAAITLIPIGGIWFVLQWQRWPVKSLRKIYLSGIALPLTLLLAVWSFFSIQIPGSVAPLPYVPILNPVDLAHLLFFLVSLKLVLRLFANDMLEMMEKRVIIGVFLVTLFVWINVTMLRTLHHWAGLAWDAHLIANSTVAQMSLSILWTVLGITAMFIASRNAWRSIWITGGFMLVVVVIKLFLVDLSASGSIARVFSFLVVGGLLILVGYLAPLPSSADRKVKGES